MQPASLNRAAKENAGVVDQDIEAAKRSQGGGHGGLASLYRCNIAGRFDGAEIRYRGYSKSHL